MREHKCMKEGFTCGNPKDDEQLNIWPSEELLPGFRKFMEEFFEVSPRPRLMGNALVRPNICGSGLYETYTPPP